MPWPEGDGNEQRKHLDLPELEGFTTLPPESARAGAGGRIWAGRGQMRIDNLLDLRLWVLGEVCEGSPGYKKAGEQSQAQRKGGRIILKADYPECY